MVATRSTIHFGITLGVATSRRKMHGEGNKNMEESMSPVHRSLAGKVLAFDLGEEMRFVREQLVGGRVRIARTLVKEGSLRLTLVGLAPGGGLDEHDAAGPITIHVVEGELELTAGGETGTYAKGELIALDRRVRHAVRSQRGAAFLLMLSASDKDQRDNADESRSPERDDPTLIDRARNE